MSDVYQESLELHRKYKGKIETHAKVPVRDFHDLSLAYSPGVAEVSRHIAGNPGAINELTSRGSTIAVISDGSAILGLGNLGPYAAMPVMEGKALLFKTFAGLDAVPICLDVHDADGIVNTVKALAPSFAGINLEDIAAPLCFEIERRLQSELDIPVMHDDQHGTAVVVLAGLINALRLAGKDMRAACIVISGAGAAGTAITELLFAYGCGNITVCDTKGVLHGLRADLNSEKIDLLSKTNQKRGGITMNEALRGADVFIGVSKGGILSDEDIKSMNEKPIIFALANPTPEIMPDIAKASGAFIVATGRSDFPNQLNNALAFPGMFKGMVDYRVSKFSDDLFIRTAETLAAIVEHPTPEKIIPGIFEPGLAEKIAHVFKAYEKS